jgi:hypothetical protein
MSHPVDVLYPPHRRTSRHQQTKGRLLSKKGLKAGQTITATTTDDSTLDTSEFSAPRNVS